MHKQERIEVHHAKNETDFSQLAKEVGFVKARQLLQQRAVAHHQTKINVSDKTLLESKRPTRLAEAIRMSNTLGNPPLENPVDKIIEASKRAVATKETSSAIEARAAAAAAAASRPGAGTGTAGGGRPQTQGGGQPQDQVPHQEGAEGVTATDCDEELDPEDAARAFDTDVAIRRSMGNLEGELLLPQLQLTSIPAGVGDTLFLHTSFLRRLSMPRNSLISLVSASMPQLSIIHLRYVTELNLASNSIGVLPAEFGIMRDLRSLHLSDNSLARLPQSFTQLCSLTELDLGRNNFATLPPELSLVSTLEKLSLNNNLFVAMQYGVVCLKKLKYLDLSYNQMAHMAVLPPLLKADSLWEHIMDVTTGREVYRNILTREKTKYAEKCTTASIERDPTFHEYQHPKKAPILYRRRKMWLSICQVHEWEPTNDPTTGQTYFSNNVSGQTQWEIPEVCDNLWRLESLETLKLTENVITAFPKSITRLEHLHVILAAKNKVRHLPADIGNLTSLHRLVLNSCELKLLPASLVDCSNLVELSAEDNQLVRLPDLMGTMASIGKLNVAANRLRQLPFTFGYSKTLTALTVQENPLRDPPMEEVGKGLDSLKWYLRQRLLIEKRGMPPPMRFQHLSIMEEVTIVYPEFVERLRQLGDMCVKTGMLNLALLGLKEIPRELFKLRKSIKKLRLDFNQNLKLVNGFPPELSWCKQITMRSCRVDALPWDMTNLKKLTTFNCEGNLFEDLPDSFTQLTTLTSLDLSKNRLYSLPEGFDTLTTLKNLNLEGNFLEEVPSGIGQNLKLQNLNLSRNRLLDVPAELARCRNIKKLNLEKNQLTKIPEAFSSLRCLELRVGHNWIDYLPEELFAGPLGRRIRCFSASENNLMELPGSVSEMDPRGTLDADYNPLVSPPPYLLSLGLPVLIQYMAIRQTRLDEFADLLEEEDFDFVVENCGPVACEVLAGGTGFLTPQDLLEFDQATHEYLNNEYFRCPASGEEIVGNLVKLRDYREHTLYSDVLNTFLKVLGEIMKTGATRKLFGEAVLVKSEKPWGRKGESCSVYVVSLHALLRASPVNYYHKEGRVSLLSLVEHALPPMPFPFTVELFKDALRLFVSPYGQVADTIQHTFPKCDCIDEVKGKPTRHSPCIKPAVAICTSIYTDEEANRRDVEEDEYLTRFEEIEEDVRIWALTKDGEKLQDMCVTKRKNVIREELAIRRELLNAELTKLKSSRAELIQLNKRRDALDRGEEYAVHRFKSQEEAIEAIQKETDKVARHADKEALIQGQVNKLKEKLATDIHILRRAAVDDLVQKYCAIDYFDKIKRFRIYAIKNNLRRPWDGTDGALFEAWRTRLLGSTSTADMSLDEIINMDAQAAEDEARRKAAEAEDLDADTEPPEYNWDGTENMPQYDFLLWFRYIKTRGILGGLFG